MTAANSVVSNSSLNRGSPDKTPLIARLVGRPLFWWITIGLLFGLPLGRSLMRQLPPAQPILGAIPPFHSAYLAGTHAGQAFDDSELRGRVWIATFLDPTDPACETLADSLFTLQRRARNLGDGYRVLSFVPSGAERQSVESFAERHHPNPFRWYFLSVSDPVETAAAHALYRSGAIAPVGPIGSGVVHGKHLAALIDRQGRIRGFYDLQLKAGMDAILSDAGLLANLDR